MLLPDEPTAADDDEEWGLLMAGYTFRFETVLRLRKRKEDELQQELAGIRMRYETEKRSLEERMGLQKEIAEKFRGRAVGPVDPSEGIIYSLYLARLSRDIAQITRLLREISIEMEEARRRLVTASQERRIMERLKDKEIMEYKEGVFRREQGFLDEIGMIRYARRWLDS